MPLTTRKEDEVLAKNGSLLGYIVPAADNRHFLTFDPDFTFIGVAENARSARVLIDDFTGQITGVRVVPLRRHLRNSTQRAWPSSSA